MNPFEKSDLERIYGTPFIDKKAPGYYPMVAKKSSDLKMPFILDKAWFYIQERLSIDAIIKELSFASVAVATFMYMQISGRLLGLGGFGYLIGLMLVVASVYNLFKASFKSLAPGVICLVGGLVLLSVKADVSYLKFLSVTAVNYIIGMGALFIAFALFKSERD